jgi:hypothetical protein
LEAGPQSKEVIHIAIERHLSATVGEKVRCRYLRDVFAGKRRTRNTRYIVYKWGQRELFVKYSPRLRLNPGVERFVGALNNPSFAAPAFFGSGRAKGQDFAIWEYRPYPHFEDFSRASIEELFKIVDAVVAISSSTELLIKEAPDVRKATLWMTPMAGKVEAGLSDLSQEGIDIHELRRGCAQLHALENDVLGRIADLGNRYFAHNDVAFHNILRTPEGKVVFVDWELAAVSAPGASLRGLAMLDQDVQHKLANRYAQGMRSNGFDVNAIDVHFVMGAMYVYWALSMGLAARSGVQIQRALAAIPSHIENRL